MYTRNFLTALLLLFGIATFAQQEHWVGTWACAPQTVDKRFMPYNNQMNNRAVRQIVKVSIGGKTIRLKLSNELSNYTRRNRERIYCTSRKRFGHTQRQG